MKIGSCFSGVGAMDIACEEFFGASTAWFVEREPYCREVLARHWPGVPCHDDVTTAASAGLEPVDILIGGPPRVDLSSAGKRRGLHAERSGLFFDFVALAAALDPQPRWVVVENVPALLSDYRGTVEGAFSDAGYGVTWARVAAAHVGAPHLRWRVFILAELGGRHRGVCHPPALPKQVGWPSPAASLFGDGEDPVSYMARRDAVAKTGVNGNGFGVQLQVAVKIGAKNWATPAARDWRDSGHEPSARARKSPHLPAEVAINTADANLRLSPAWVETLMGLPINWTALEGDLDPRPWPSPRVRGMWGDSPQLPHEPPRLCDPSQVPNRRARLKALGNLNPPQQYLAALRMMRDGPAQGMLFA